jgi:predicted kinase
MKKGVHMEAIVFIGIQASGKSTFYKEWFFKTHMRISLDMLKTRTRENILLEACIAAKQPFVVDNTNPTIEDRRKYIEKAKENRFKIIGYFFQTTSSEAAARNKDRSGKEVVPLAAIYGTNKKLQLPSYEEGFEEIYYVRIGENNKFIIEEQINC